MTLRPRGGLLNSKKITGTQDYVPTCNKDTTGIIVMFLIQNKLKYILGKQRLQKWTRGCLAIVNSAGFIRYWAPLFKSEGPAQVAVIVLTFLLTILGPMVPFEDWEKLGLLCWGTNPVTINLLLFQFCPMIICVIQTL